MPRRRTKTSWLHRRSRPLIGAIAVLGATNTAYLTATRLSGSEAACPTDGCSKVLGSAYAEVFGQPLALFGLVAYIAMAIFALAPLALGSEDKDRRMKVENTSWFLLFLGATAMMIFSWYLMYIMVAKFVVPQGAAAICIYCIASAVFATLMFILTALGRTWEDVGQLLFAGFIIAVVTIIGSLGVYAHIDKPVAGSYLITAADGSPAPGVLPITNTSEEAELALAKHLKETEAKMYGAYWCPHCRDQKSLFGVAAIPEIPYIECDPKGKAAETDLCQAELAKATEQELAATGNKAGFPTWKIGDKYYPGQQSLTDLAQYSGYQGPSNFKNPK